jgi:hypothetical protein
MACRRWADIAHSIAVLHTANHLSDPDEGYDMCQQHQFLLRVMS